VESRIATLCLSLKHFWFPKPKAPSRYGRTTCRSSTQKANALDDSAGLIDSLPPHSLVVYIGCSASGNPGPVGVGVFLVYSHPDGTRLTHRLFHHLDNSTLSAGVLNGIGITLSFISENQTLKNNLHLCSFHILTDHAWAISSFKKGIPQKHVLYPLISGLRKWIEDDFSFNKPTFCWIPGLLPGVVTATSLANKGSKNPTIISPESDQNSFCVVSPNRSRFEYSKLRGGPSSTILPG
jgi:hypothetical protein